MANVRRTTLRDVAKLADVHPSTASRALNGAPGRTSTETVERILTAAATLGYEPDYLARALKTRKTFLIGVTVPNLLNGVFTAAVRGLQTVLGEAGYIVILANTDGDHSGEGALVRAMVSRQVDGLALMTSHLHSPLLDELGDVGVPTILICRVVDGWDIPAVVVDDHWGMAHAVGHLVELGHRRIAHIGGPHNTSTGRERYHGYVAGLEAAGIALDPSLVTMASSYDEEAGEDACRELLSWTNDFTAIAAASDAIAFGCYDALDRAGLSIPNDISVVGFGGMPFGRRANPSLTSISMPYNDVGRIGGQLLLDLINGDEVKSDVVRLRGELIVRGSVASVPG